MLISLRCILQGRSPRGNNGISLVPCSIQQSEKMLVNCILRKTTMCNILKLYLLKGKDTVLVIILSVFSDGKSLSENIRLQNVHTMVYKLSTNTKTERCNPIWINVLELLTVSMFMSQHFPSRFVHIIKKKRPEFTFPV